MQEGLYQAIVIRAIKDYLRPQYKTEVINWVVNMEGSFYLCADSMGLDPIILREMLVDKMILIDTAGTATLFIGEPVRMRV